VNILARVTRDSSRNYFILDESSTSIYSIVRQIMTRTRANREFYDKRIEVPVKETTYIL